MSEEITTKIERELSRLLSLTLAQQANIHDEGDTTAVIVLPGFIWNEDGKLEVKK